MQLERHGTRALTLQLAHPEAHRQWIVSKETGCERHSPGFRALQSAHVPLPGTVLMSSCSVRSLRACWRLFSADAMLLREKLRSQGGGDGSARTGTNPRGRSWVFEDGGKAPLVTEQFIELGRLP